MTTVPIEKVIANLDPPPDGAPPERIEIEQEVRSILLELQAEDPSLAIRVPEDIDAIYSAAGEVCAIKALARHVSKSAR